MLVPAAASSVDQRRRCRLVEKRSNGTRILSQGPLATSLLTRIVRVLKIEIDII